MKYHWIRNGKTNRMPFSGDMWAQDFQRKKGSIGHLLDFSKNVTKISFAYCRYVIFGCNI